jgi:hypothetical protein
METALQALKRQLIDMLPPDEQTQKIKYEIDRHILKEYDQMEACFQNGYIEGASEHSGLPRKYTVFDDYYTTVFGQKPKYFLDKEKAIEALFKKNKI